MLWLSSEFAAPSWPESIPRSGLVVSDGLSDSCEVNAIKYLEKFSTGDCQFRNFTHHVTGNEFLMAGRGLETL